MTARRLEIFVIVTIIGIIGIIYAFTQKPALAPTVALTPDQTTDETTPSATGLTINPNPTAVVLPPQQVPTTTVEYRGMNGKNAFELLKSSHTIESKHYSFGDMVVSIDGIAPDANHFWALYVNGQFSQVGASDYVTKDSDMIKWQIDAVAN